MVGATVGASQTSGLKLRNNLKQLSMVLDSTKKKGARQMRCGFVWAASAVSGQRGAATLLLSVDHLFHLLD